MDLVFWKFKKGGFKEPNKLYKEIEKDDGKIDCLDNIPVDDILDRLDQFFMRPGWEKLDEQTYEYEDEYAIQIETSMSYMDQFIILNSYDLPLEEIEDIIDIMSEEFDITFYDPELDEWHGNKNDYL